MADHDFTFGCVSGGGSGYGHGKGEGSALGNRLVSTFSVRTIKFAGKGFGKSQGTGGYGGKGIGRGSAGEERQRA